jgi:hypothetical protein
MQLRSLERSKVRPVLRQMQQPCTVVSESWAACDCQNKIDQVATEHDQASGWRRADDASCL